MSEDISASLLRRRPSEASTSSTPTLSSAAASQAATPRLGDFSKLLAPSLTCTPEHENPPSLGNFSRIFTTLSPSLSKSSPKPRSPEFCPSPPIEQCSPRSTTSVGHVPESLASVRDSLRRKLFSSLSPSALDSEVDESSQIDTDGYHSLTPDTTPPSSLERELPPIANLSLATQPFFDILRRPKSDAPAKPVLQPVFSYQLIKHGPLMTVYNEPRSVAQQHESLLQRLIPHRALDTALTARSPGIAENGIHVFLDMSNINISFQQALRNRYGLAENARFVPLPQLNLSFLTEILVRDRNINILNAGCSVQPGRSEPSFIRDLRNLDYRVDLRERKRTEEPTRTPQKGSYYGQYSSSDEASLQTQVRYVEDLVDETLQTRIAESVMEHFATPGTLIIATGDAKPAKYSDGFFMYADRALKMGWHVEVVSWRTSLSSSWRNPEWTALWGDRFRVIELDAFLDNLLLLVSS